MSESKPQASAMGDSKGSSPRSGSLDDVDKEKQAAQPVGDDIQKDDDSFLVSWAGPDDPENPQNWATSRRLGVTSIWIISNIVTAITSSIYSSGSSQIGAEFHSSTPVVTLGISLYLVGYCVGPPFWGPLSEKFGRRWPLVVGMAGFTLFCLPVALGQNMETLIIGRFFCGTFGAAPLSITGGALVDIWSAIDRGVALACCIGTVFGTPVIAPVMGNFITQSYLGWRWDNWLSAIIGLATTIGALVFMPETHAPTILKKKAAKLRKSTGDAQYHSEFDNESNSIGVIVSTYLVRPFRLLVQEPILALVTIYQAFIYGILYLVFVAYPIAFRENRHWALGVSSLPLLGLLVGILLGGGTVVYVTKTKFARDTAKNKGVIIPEKRLPVMIAGSFMIPIGFFIFGWTSDPSIHWSGMVVGSIPLGMGMFMVFVQCFNFIIDVYLRIANSAIAGNTFVRSLFGAAFPLFGPYMYHNLGVNWASSTLGFISIAMIPIPIAFYRYGHTIRGWSKNVMNKN